ncbi:MAG: hypothetical protein LBR16_03330 [Treponema sp.]|jgi:hypothetical protein|nr:hypothetical protein [Treponema sp.]
MLWICSFAAAVLCAVLINHFLLNCLAGSTRTGMKALSWVVCLLLALAFSIAGSLHSLLNSFIDTNVARLETAVAESFPEMDIFEDPIDPSRITAALQDARGGIDSFTGKGIGHLLFSGTVEKYITPILASLEGGAADAAGYANANGVVTLNSFITALKMRLLAALNPLFVGAQLVMVGLLVVYTLICVCVMLRVRKAASRESLSS